MKNTECGVRSLSTEHLGKKIKGGYFEYPLILPNFVKP